jgi:heme/copper-type cytochrome/quinol oxidase subunit 2
MDSRESHVQSGVPRLLNTDSALVVPSSLALRFLVTSADILHS